MARQIGIVLCRVAAAVLVVQAIRAFGYTLPVLFFEVGEIEADLLAFGLLGLVPGLAAIGLWVFADKISSFATAGEIAELQQLLTGVDVIRLGTALIGIFLLIQGIISATAIEVGELARPNLGDDYRTMIDRHKAEVMGMRASFVTQIALAIALILGRDRLGELFGKARTAGVDTRAPATRGEN